MIARGRAVECVLGSAIRVWRQRSGMSQIAFAAILGISPSFLCDIEHNKRRVSDKILRYLQQAEQRQ
jgi:transcriptional regulator with XRE-family HTH domain